MEGPVDGAAIRLPGMMAGRALDVLAGRVPAAAARDAATVMLLRPVPAAGGGSLARHADHGLEVYMLRRKSSMAFAPGAFVFPGGSVDTRDADEEVARTGPDVADLGAIFDAPARLARALVCAAVRETFEESGVLLAGPSAATVVADTSGDDWEADRHALLDRSISLAEMLGRRRLVLRADLLKPWSRWITPVVDAGRKKEIVLWLPTAVTLGELAACGTMAAALASPRPVTPLLPEVTIREGTPWLSVPGEQEYPL